MNITNCSKKKNGFLLFWKIFSKYEGISILIDNLEKFAILIL
jgi:hypothetical protein